MHLLNFLNIKYMCVNTWFSMQETACSTGTTRVYIFTGLWLIVVQVFM